MRMPIWVWGAYWRNLANTTEPSVCCGDAALCQITLTTCYYYYYYYYYKRRLLECCAVV